MPIKKFLILEISLFIGLTLIFTLNVLLRKEKVNSQTVKVALDYYSSIEMEGSDTLENNVWLRMIKEKYGFDVKVEYALPTSQYETKTNTVIGSGEIPDMFGININQFATLTKAGLIYDGLAEAYDKYASDELKIAMGWDDTLKENSPNFKKWVVNGKLMGIPIKNSTYSEGWILYIRKDWLDIIGEDTPKTMDDVEIILTKFKENGLGKGLGLNEDILYSNAGSANFVFNAYGAYPTLFIEDENGNVDFGFFSENTKQALNKLKSWYSKGLIYSEFASSSSDIIGQKIANGDIGMIYGVMSIPLWRGSANVSTFDEAEWICCKAPGLSENQDTILGVSSTGSEAYVVRKAYSNPERLIQMLNLYYDSMYGFDGDFERFDKFCEAYPFDMEPENKNYFRAEEVKRALDIDRLNSNFTKFSYDTETDDIEYFKLNTESRFYYEKVRDYLINGKDSSGKN